MIDFTSSVSSRFIRYTAFDTMSDSRKVGIVRPTTEGQLVLLKQLKMELEELSLETYLGPEAVLMAKLKGNKANIPTIGFMAHVDTADDVMGNGVKAQRCIYNGGDIVLLGTTIKECDNKNLLNYIGKEIITSDGTTLLGADDKAGVSEIMEAITYLVKNPNIEHGDIELFFTPDEETGSGVDSFPFDKMKSVCCYTMDGGEEGEIEAECFNAASIKISIKGVAMHLGYAKGKMVNALTVASKIISSLPMQESPEATDKKDGYYCVSELNGNHVKAEMEILIRDFDYDNFLARIENVEKIAAAVAALDHAKVTVTSSHTYHNMVLANNGHPEAMNSIVEAANKIGLNVHEEIIRGGTDGARIAENGIPCPNIFTGGNNFHSLEEWISCDSMSKAVNLILSIISWWAER